MSSWCTRQQQHQPLSLFDKDAFDVDCFVCDGIFFSVAVDVVPKRGSSKGPAIFTLLALNEQLKLLRLVCVCVCLVCDQSASNARLNGGWGDDERERERPDNWTGAEREREIKKRRRRRGGRRIGSRQNARHGRPCLLPNPTLYSPILLFAFRPREKTTRGEKLAHPNTQQ